MQLILTLKEASITKGIKLTTQSMFQTSDPANPADPLVNPVVAQPNVSNVSPYANLLGSIVNEHGAPKYASVELALEGLRNAQEFIPGLKAQLTSKDAELEQLRAKAQEIETLKQAVAELTSMSQNAPAPQAPVFSEEKLAEFVNSQLTRRDQATTEKTNQRNVASRLEAVHGADAEKVFNAKALEFDMTPDALAQMSAKNPKAVLTMLGIKEAPVQGTLFRPTTSSLNTAGLPPAQGSFIGRNPNPPVIGATHSEMLEASRRAALMVEEVHAQGLTLDALSDPKVYRKHFK